MRIGDQIQISGKKITPLKSKSTSTSLKKIETIGQSTLNSKGQIIASKIQDKATYFLLKADAQSSPKWESKEKLLITHKNVIEKYERQQKAFLASQQQQIQRPPIVINNSDDSDEDKNKLNGKRKLCIGGKAPIISNSGKKVCNETTKEGQAASTGLFSSKLQEMKNKLQDGNIQQYLEKQIKSNPTVTESVTYPITSISNNQSDNQSFQKRNNLFDTNNYYNIAAQIKTNNNTFANNNINTINNFSNNNTKISHRLLFDSQPVNPIINPKNVPKVIEKLIQKENQMQQQLPSVQETSKNFSDIENISYLNNSISEEQKSNNPFNKNITNNNSSSKNASKQQSNTLTKSTSTGSILFKKDDLDLAKKKASSEQPKLPQINEPEQQKSSINKLSASNSFPSMKNNNNNNILLAKKKSLSSDEGKSKSSVTKDNQSKVGQMKPNPSNNNDQIKEKKPATQPQVQNKKSEVPIIEQEEMTQDDIVLKKKSLDFGSYLHQVFGFNNNKQTPKKSGIKNAYSPSKSPMIDNSKKNQDNQQSQVIDSQIEGPPKDGPLNEVLQQNLQRLNQIISNSEKKRLNKSANSTDINHELNGFELEGDCLNQKQVSQMEVEDSVLKQYEIEKANYSQFQNQLIQEYINTDCDNQNHFDDDLEDDLYGQGYVLQLEKGSQKLQQQQEISQKESSNKFNFQGLQVEKKENLLKVTLPQEQTLEQSIAQKEQLQSTFESTEQEEYKSNEQKKQLASIYKDKQIAQSHLSSENILPASLESNLHQTQAEQAACLFNVVEKAQKILPEQGHFSVGDKAKRIIACRPKENEILMDIEWEARLDGNIPEKSTLSSKLVREYDHDLLIEFYESKIKFTYKNAERKKQTQSLNASVKKEYNSPNQNQ